MKTLIATFAGDSGDGIQLLGSAFADVIAQQNLELNTLPDFPAEIRAPAGTMSGVSGFQIQWSDSQVLTAGHKSDILIAFNAAGFKKFISQ
jgi:2-oxoglutarate ferredoxin oxidoreductase subunit alpha